MENQLVAEILDLMYSRPDKFDTVYHRIVIGFWDEASDEGYTVYAVIEDNRKPPAVAEVGESSYGSFTVKEALEALRNELTKDD